MVWSPEKLTFNPAVIHFSPVFKMGSFGKNMFFYSGPFRHLHCQWRRNGLALPHALQSFQLVHGAIQLPLQLRHVAHDFVQYFRRRQRRRRLPRLLLLFFMLLALRIVLRFAKRIPGANSNAKLKPCSNQISFGFLPLFLPAGKFPAPTHLPLWGWRLFRFLRVRKACWMQCFTHNPHGVAGCEHLMQSPALACRR
jgi:hypothetical protein